MTNSLPLCVDLDGTLLKVDVLYECLLRLIKTNFLYIFIIPFWFLKGRAYLKAKVGSKANLAIDNLPQNQGLIDWIKNEKARGRQIILATAADKSIADKIAEHFGFFDAVFASDGKKNLRGDNKRLLLNQLYGQKGYDYAGDSKFDLKVWKDANAAILINPSFKLEQAAKRYGNVTKIFKSQDQNFWITLLKAIRIHHCLKNSLIFLPLFLSDLLGDVNSWRMIFEGFLSFSALSSIVYIINDFLDLESDRRHLSKKTRGFASGMLAPKHGFYAIIFLLVVAIAFFNMLPSKFIIIALLYFALSLAYSLYLKNKMLIDVLLLAFFYALRIFAGMVLLDQGYSSWLLIFSIFFFMGLALIKRYIELNNLPVGSFVAAGRRYNRDQKKFVKVLGIVSGFISFLVFVLYLHSEKANTVYQHIEFMYPITFLMLYWLQRIWFLADRGKVHDDPVFFAITDKTTYWLGLITAILVFCARLSIKGSSLRL